MRVRLSGKLDNATKELLREAASFYASNLMPKKLTKNISVSVQLVPNLLKKERIFGDIEWTDRPRNPRKFRIRICSDLSQKKLLKVLAHEMVHVKQYAKGELFDYADGHVKYMGQHHDPAKINYFNHLWEIEALGREIGLYYQYRSYRKNQSKSKN